MVDHVNQNSEQPAQLKTWVKSLKELSARIPEIIPGNWAEYREQLRAVTRNKQD